jgi:putative DNA primase/helicase
MDAILQRPGGPETSASQAELPRTILPHHLAELRHSGLSDATIEAAGIYSEDNHLRAAAILNWRGGTKRLVPAIVYPYHDENGANGYLRIKPDRPRVKGG